ncbi:hypothetical protein Hypma_013931 [Hypsizygus marmoreus]|uniref:Ribosomal RNA methyltransferase FtsJ domain-containing protein n=1 Tax=Hypsizygus marmoreus TaxID=39966 RepID=A0A369KB02_HYPMA|nr:hypothetical protein Hypma_013931 [Hypsizygus marmoreus]
MQAVLPLKTERTLAELNELRRQTAKEVTARAQLEFQKRQSDAPTIELQRAWFRSMRNVLEEVDTAVRCIPTRTPWYFLDIGCCPGGFSSYILNKNLFATGMGISLPVESGGHSFLLEDELHPRLDLHMADLTYYQLGPYPIADTRLQPLPFSDHQFDMVLLDGHPLRTAPESQGGGRKRMSDRLLVAQLVICLKAVAASGTLVIKLSKPERVVTAKIMYMMWILAADVATWKPVCMHATRDTFYFIAKGVGLGRGKALWAQWLWELQALWVQLTWGGSQGKGRTLEEEDFDFVVSTQEMRKYFGERLGALSRPIWEVQKQSMEGWKKAAADGF